MAWTTSLADLRKLLNDGPKDKLRYRKRVIGIQNGANLIFKTFEFRRTESLVGATAPVGVYVDDTPVTVVSDDVPSGEFVLADAPTDGQTLRATYFIQWFIDDELTEFLQTAGQWIGIFDVTAIQDGLQPAAIRYAAGLAYQKLSLRFAENMSEIYQLEDTPLDKSWNPVDIYAKLSDQMLKAATMIRDDFYTRKGQAKAPRFGSLYGNVQDPAPNR